MYGFVSRFKLAVMMNLVKHASMYDDVFECVQGIVLWVNLLTTLLRQAVVPHPLPFVREPQYEDP